MSPVKILIIEDNPLNLKLTQTLLSHAGYKIITANDGETGIKTATQQKPDLILMDMQLPKLSGYEATQHLKSKAQTMHIPIVALTASALPEEREQAYAAGCDGYIVKPINTRQFPKQIASYLRGKFD